MTNLSSLADSYGVYSYKDDLLYWKAENFSNWRHRALSVLQDWLMNAYIVKLDEEIFTERPIFTPDIFGGKENKEEDDLSLMNGDTIIESEVPPQDQLEEEDVSEDWDNERWDNLFIQMFDTSRTHSFCVVDLYNKPPWWRIFSEREIESIKYNEDGHPIGCHVSWTLELPKSNGIFLNFDDDLVFYDRNKNDENATAIFVPFGVPQGNKLGICDLQPIWSLDIDIRYINLDITNNSAKTSGFYFLKFGDALKSAGSQEIVNVMDIIGSNRAVGAKEGALKDIIAIHPEQCQFSIEALISKLKLFASICRLPLTFFLGEKETGGVFTEGFTDEAKINKKKKYIFGQFKPYIKDLIKMRWGIELEDVEVWIEEEETEELDFSKDEEKINNGKIEKKSETERPN